MSNSLNNPIYGCVLMGGQSRRFGGVNKSQFNVGGQALFEHVIQSANDQVTELAIGLGTNDIDHHALHKLTILTDFYHDAGPMAGLHAAMLWADNQTVLKHEPAAYIATFACDTPAFPSNMVTCLSNVLADNGTKIALPRHKGRVHTALGLWSTSLLSDLVRSIEACELALTRWAMAQGAVIVDFDDAGPLDFFNINTPEDAAKYEQLLLNNSMKKLKTPITY